MTDISLTVDDNHQEVRRKISTSSSSAVIEEASVGPASALVGENAKEEGADKKLRVLFLICLAAVILGWWISSTVLGATRDRWQVYAVSGILACST